MRICLWHGWLLEGAGSNVYTARVAERFAAAGHDVVLLCQEGHPERYPWIDAWGTVDASGPSELTARPDGGDRGRCTLLRPEIGTLLPVFVLDEYEGFKVKRFVDLTDAELQTYLHRNADALRVATAWQDSEAVITGHAIPGGPVGRLALGPGTYVTKIHGSDLEYAIRPQERYRRLAGEGLRAARAITGSSSDVLRRCAELVPGIEHLLRVAPPGVDTGVFRPRPRAEALGEAADRLGDDADVVRGRPSSLDAAVAEALAHRDGNALDELATTYDQTVPDPGTAERLRRLSGGEGALIGYFGKLIPQKGVDLLLVGARRSAHRPTTLVVGFGLFREWLDALAMALRANDLEALAWLVERGGITAEAVDASAMGAPLTTIFTGRLDHRYAPGALAAMDVLVVPSVLDEAFGMVAAEGAAAGALPLVARHSGLAEVASTLEAAVGSDGLFSFEPGAGAVGRVATGLDRLLSLPPEEVAALRVAVRDVVVREWSWDRTAEKLLEAARV
jgi:glycosyltransferase involved in cell wall biosynthesis